MSGEIMALYRYLLRWGWKVLDYSTDDFGCLSVRLYMQSKLDWNPVIITISPYGMFHAGHKSTGPIT